MSYFMKSAVTLGGCIGVFTKVVAVIGWRIRKSRVLLTR